MVTSFAETNFLERLVYTSIDYLKPDSKIVRCVTGIITGSQLNKKSCK